MGVLVLCDTRGDPHNSEDVHMCGLPQTASPLTARIRQRRGLCSLDHATPKVEVQVHSPPIGALILVAHELLLLAEPLYQIECSCALPNAWRACDDECQRLCSLAAALLHPVEQLPVAAPHVQAFAEWCSQELWQTRWQVQAHVLLFQVHHQIGPLREVLAGQAGCRRQQEGESKASLLNPKLEFCRLATSTAQNPATSHLLPWIHLQRRRQKP